MQLLQQANRSNTGAINGIRINIMGWCRRHCAIMARGHQVSLCGERGWWCYVMVIVTVIAYCDYPTPIRLGISTSRLLKPRLPGHRVTRKYWYGYLTIENLSQLKASCGFNPCMQKTNGSIPEQSKPDQISLLIAIPTTQAFPPNHGPIQ